MGKAAWYMNRLRAMSVGEIVWRIRQRLLQRQEMRRFATPQSILEPLYPSAAEVSRPQGAEPPTECLSAGTNLPIGEGRQEVLDFERIRLLGGYDYDMFATDWHATFSSPAVWPLTLSYNLDYKQRDDLGDARLNWELNRHRQFTRLAADGSPQAIARLHFLLHDWDRSNPFLHGISWTSAMEIGLRAISWVVAARLLQERIDADPTRADRTVMEQIRADLLTGAANMADYLSAHQSGFSSANNHLIVETAAIAVVASELGQTERLERASDMLTRELPRQVSADGVDLESSLHYHSFVLEAYLIVWRELRQQGIAVDPSWPPMLRKMAQFIAASRVAEGVACVFGDDDEARIIDLGFGDEDYYQKVLNLYCEVSREPLSPLATAGRITFAEGGYTFMRRWRMFVGMDHAPLGFGPIAAHGHADALSFQLFLDGRPILIDPGTYLYHIDLNRRNALRSTIMHNTVEIDGANQSQMLGPFLWGKKARTTLNAAEAFTVEATVAGVHTRTLHTRRLTLDSDTLTVLDTFTPSTGQSSPSPSRNSSSSTPWKATFIVAPGLPVKISGNTATIANLLTLTITTPSPAPTLTTYTVEVASTYGTLRHATAIRIIGTSPSILTTLRPL